MTLAQYNKIKRVLEIGEKELIDEFLKGKQDITSPEFEEALLKIKELIIEEAGFVLFDYEAFELEEYVKLKGAKGEKGQEGSIGTKGEEGEQGPIGITGQEGSQGVKGDKGDSGPQGNPGKTYIAIRGKQGERGDKGDSVDIEELKANTDKIIKTQIEAQISSPLFGKRVLDMTVEEQERIIEPVRRGLLGVRKEISRLGGLISAEDLWNRSDSTLTTHTAGDDISLGGDIYMEAGKRIHFPHWLEVGYIRGMTGQGTIEFSARADGITYFRLGRGSINANMPATFSTLSTGQGQTELYMMNQNIRTGDSVTFGTITSGDITILDTLPILIFKDSNNTGDAVQGYIEWRDSNNLRLGYFGFSSVGHDDIILKNESSGGHIAIKTTEGGKFQIFADVNVTGGLFTAMTGTVTTNGTTGDHGEIIEGDGTDFAGEIAVGDAIKIESSVPAEYEIFTVVHINSGTQLEVDSAYAGNNLSGLDIWSDADIFTIDTGDGANLLTVDKSGNLTATGSYNTLSIIPMGNYTYLSGDGLFNSGLTIGIPISAGNDFFYGWNGTEHHKFGNSGQVEISDDGFITATGNIDLISDSNKLRLGVGNDFELYHDGTDNFISGIDAVDGTGGDDGIDAAFLNFFGGKGGDITSGSGFAKTGGRGSLLTFRSGAGGDIDDGTIPIGGIGGNFGMSAGKGGDATGGSNKTGGVGGRFIFNSGEGGDASGGTGTSIGGDAGGMHFRPALGGTGATANGADGFMTFGDHDGGAGTNYIQITRSGDLTFVGSAGLPYGAFFGNNIDWTHNDFSGGGTFIIINTLTGGNVNNTTFQNTQELLIDKAGDYLITWSASVEVAVANKHIEVAPGINGTANVAGRQHIELPSALKEESVSGTAILSITAGQTLSLMITNVDDDTAVEVHHVNLSAVQIGG